MLAEAENVSLKGDMIVHHARRLEEKLSIPADAQPRFEPSWLRCLQQRYGFRWRRSYGESSSVDMEQARAEIERLKLIIGGFRPCDVYNMDETAFFYNAAPRGSICHKAAPSFKQDKSRLTMAVCANADGSDKLPLLFLGKAAKPRWYAHKPSGVQYFGTEKGWMTAWMYQQWLVGVDEQMRAADRHILLLVDNASSHHEVGLSLTNIRVDRLPPNTTAKIQPMDQGIIYCIKREVLHQKMVHALDSLGESLEDPYKADVLTAIIWCEAAWEDVGAGTIANCWKHSGLMNKASVGFMLN